MSDVNKTLEYLLLDFVKISITIDDIRLRSKLNINQTLMFTKKSFFYTIIGFTQSGSLNDTADFFQLIARSYKNEKPNNITAVDKVHLKADCINGSIANGIRDPILYNFTPVKPPGLKIFKEPRIKHFKRINRYVLFHITFYLEDDDHKPVDFNGETISFTCQLVKIQFYNFEY